MSRTEYILILSIVSILPLSRVNGRVFEENVYRMSRVYLTYNYCATRDDSKTNMMV